MVIFAWGKFHENIGKTFHMGLIFMILLIFTSQNHMGFILRGRNFREEVNIAKKAKITPYEKYPRLQYISKCHSETLPDNIPQ